MKRVSIERDKSRGSAGLIEGETDDGRRWVLLCNEQGEPEVFWPELDGSGAPVDEWGIHLGGPVETVRHILKAGPDDELLSSYPVWDDGMRGLIFAISPSQHPRDNTWTRMHHFISRLYHEVDPETGRPRDSEGWEVSDEDREAARFKSADEGGDPGLGKGADHPARPGAPADGGLGHPVDDDLGDQSLAP